jgi:hypothetical protein
MHALISNLLAVALVAHATIGCCHHHWHCAGESASIDSIAVQACQCCPHHTDFGCEHPAEGEPCSGEFECQGVCSYLPTQRAEVDHSFDGVAFDMMVPLNSTAVYLANCTDAALAVVEHNCNSPPPPTLVQLRQLLLI